MEALALGDDASLAPMRCANGVSAGAALLQRCVEHAVAANRRWEQDPMFGVEHTSRHQLVLHLLGYTARLRYHNGERVQGDRWWEDPWSGKPEGVYVALMQKATEHRKELQLREDRLEIALGDGSPRWRSIGRELSTDAAALEVLADLLVLGGVSLRLAW